MTHILADGTEVDDSIPVKMVDGLYYLLTKRELEELVERSERVKRDAPLKRKQELLNSSRSEGGFGSPKEQLDFIAANGIANWTLDRSTREAEIDKIIAQEFGILPPINTFRKSLFKYDPNGNVYKDGIFFDTFINAKPTHVIPIVSGQYFEFFSDGVLNTIDANGNHTPLDQALGANRNIIDFVRTYYPHVLIQNLTNTDKLLTI